MRKYEKNLCKITGIINVFLAVYIIVSMFLSIRLLATNEPNLGILSFNMFYKVLFLIAPICILLYSYIKKLYNKYDYEMESEFKNILHLRCFSGVIAIFATSLIQILFFYLTFIAETSYGHTFSFALIFLLIAFPALLSFIFIKGVKDENPKICTICKIIISIPSIIIFIIFCILWIFNLITA